MKLIQIVMAATLLAFSAMHANAETTNRFVKMEAVPDIPSGIRDDANGSLVVGITDQSNTGSGGGRWVVFSLNFSKLTCLGPFSIDQSVLFYTLYVNDQRLLSFNTKFKYAIQGEIGGDFSTGLIFTDVNQHELTGWFDDPVTDDIHAIVRGESHEYPPGNGPIVLEGWLTN